MTAKKKAGKRQYSKGIVLLVIALNVAYTAAVLFVNYSGHDVPDSLNYSWFQFTCVELVALAGVTITKTLRNTSVDGNPISKFTEWVDQHFGDTGKSTDNENKGDEANGLEDEAD